MIIMKICSTKTLVKISKLSHIGFLGGFLFSFANHKKLIFSHIFQVFKETRWKYFPKKKSAKLSEEELHKLLAKQIEIGSEAEEIAIKYEEKRLRELGKEELIAGITRVSKKNVREGYDIASFNGDVITTVYDRFIEVKATTGESPYFYWSENEIEVAKKKQDRYFVYLYTNLRNETKRKLTVIQNPYHEIFEKDFSDKKEISTWRIMWHG